MAVTIQLYNHTRKLFSNGEVDLADLKVMLLDSDASFNAANTVVGDVSADEVDGSGWTTGGETIASAAITVVNTNEARLDGNDISVTAVGGSIGPATCAVIYDDDAGTKNLLAFIDFDGAKEAGEGTAFRITWNAAGIITWAPPA